MSRFDIGALVCVLLIAFGFNVSTCNQKENAQAAAMESIERLHRAVSVADSLAVVAETYLDSANYWKGVAQAATPLLDSTDHWLQRNRATLPTAAARDLKNIISWKNPH